MLETAVRDRFHDLRLKQQVAERSAVDTDVGTFGASSRDGQVALLGFTVSDRSICARRDCRAIGRLDLLVGVVDEVFLAGRHGGGCSWVGEGLEVVIVRRVRLLP